MMEYADWRRKIPFTDEQIAAALDRYAAELVAGGHAPQPWLEGMAARTRSGRVSLRAYTEALPYLVTHCSVLGCQKKALYRMGAEGRCSVHRLVVSAGRAKRRQSYEMVSSQMAAARKAADYRTLADTRSTRGVPRGGVVEYVRPKVR